MPEYGGVANMLALLFVMITFAAVRWAFARGNKNGNFREDQPHPKVPALAPGEGEPQC